MKDGGRRCNKVKEGCKGIVGVDQKLDFVEMK